MDTLNERISGEQRGRVSQLQELAGTLENVHRTADRRFQESGEEIARTQRDLRGELARHAANFAEELNRRSAELGGALKREADELHTRKADRAALGALFAELAARLADDFRKPNDA